jgi:hypothetical protein
MDTEDQKPPAVWLRLCGSLVGAILSGLGAFVLIFLGALTGALPRELNVAMLTAVLASIGGVIGFLNPRHTLNSLWIFIPGGFSD